MTGKIGKYDAFWAEIWEMYMGMQFAWRQCFYYLHVEIDSKNLVDNMIIGKFKINGNLSTLVHRIQEILKLNWHVHSIILGEKEIRVSIG